MMVTISITDGIAERIKCIGAITREMTPDPDIVWVEGDDGKNLVAGYTACILHGLDGLTTNKETP